MTKNGEIKMIVGKEDIKPEKTWITVWVPKELKDKIIEIARDEDRSISAVVFRMLKKGLKLGDQIKFN